MIENRIDHSSMFPILARKVAAVRRRSCGVNCSIPTVLGDWIAVGIEQRLTIFIGYRPGQIPSHCDAHGMGLYLLDLLLCGQGKRKSFPWCRRSGSRQGWSGRHVCESAVFRLSDGIVHQRFYRSRRPRMPITSHWRCAVTRISFKARLNFIRK